MTKRYDEETGKLVEVQEEGETVVNLPELRTKIQSINGNPDMKDGLLKIITYLEKEG